MWGFELNELENSGILGMSFSSSSGATNPGVENSDISGKSSPQIGGVSITAKTNFANSASSADSEMGSSSQTSQVSRISDFQVIFLNISFSDFIVQIKYLRWNHY